jgi:DNA-binding response OmpR family regulator
MKTVLIVEDEPRIAGIARDYLTRAAFTVTVAATGDEALRVCRARPPDLVVLDLGLPGLDGLDVARELRRASEVPIIMLTARVDETDRLIGLELGADDYITKPFSPRELVARVRAVLRRVGARDAHEGVTRTGDLVIDRPRMKVTVGARDVDLTSTEFLILSTLASQPGRVYTRAQLLDVAGGADADAFDRVIDAHVKNIRRKLEPDPHRPRYVLTVHGVGYKLAEP